MASQLASSCQIHQHDIGVVPHSVENDVFAVWGRELNIPVFDVLTMLRGQDHQALWVPWDGHPNAEAHRRIAAFLVDKILEEPAFSGEPEAH